MWSRLDPLICIVSQKVWSYAAIIVQATAWVLDKIKGPLHRAATTMYVLHSSRMGTGPPFLECHRVTFPPKKPYICVGFFGIPLRLASFFATALEIEAFHSSCCY